MQGIGTPADAGRGASVRYFFNLSENGRSVLDGEGQELENIEAAREAALRAARCIVSSDAKGGSIDLTSSIEVVDDAGLTAFILKLCDAVTVKR